MESHELIKSGIIIVVGVAIYIIAGYILRRLIRSAVYSGKHVSTDVNDAKKRAETLLGLFNPIWKISIITITSAILLRSIFPSVDLSPLFASAGIIGVAIGFGAQSLVKDLLTGVFIISENQYRVGDVVEIEEASGTVERIGTRSTVLRDISGNVHYIPNGMIQHVINKTMGYSVARLTLSIDPSADIDQVIEIINDVGQKISTAEKWKDKILEAPKFLRIEDISGTYTTVVIGGKTLPSEQWSVVAELRKRLLVELGEAKIKLAKQLLRTRP